MQIGNFVSYIGAPGIGRVGDMRDDQVRVDFFESAAEPQAQSVWKERSHVGRVRLEDETRVYFLDGQSRWRAGRVVGARDDYYFVKVPNVKGLVEIDEWLLHTRWDKPPRDPLEVLLSGANETPRYRDAREPVRRLLLRERAATASATGIMSAGVSMHAHQIAAALRIIRDPVQRYLLADEVGMGKTIEAGLVMRQLLIDDPTRRLAAIVPDALVAQWRSELCDKFFLDDFPSADGGARFSVMGHSQVDIWKDLADVDLLVVDEAHELAQTGGPDESPYRELASLARAAPRVLMLSATPFTRGPTTHLALLHLLDPQLFRWEDKEQFARLLAARRDLAFAVFGLDPDPDPGNPELLELQFEEIRAQIPDDELLRQAMARAMDVFGPAGTDPDMVDEERLRTAVESVRTHISETYRLHHRVIRTRRHETAMQKLDDDGLLTPFDFTGRARPKPVRLEASEEHSAGARAVATWAAECAAAILDDDLDPAAYAPVLGILVSRTGGPADDLAAILERRVSGEEQLALGLGEAELLDAAPTLEFESRVLADLQTVVGTDGLSELAAGIARVRPPTRAVVFCGHGALAEDLVAAVRELEGPSARTFEHLLTQSETQREAATAAWRQSGGALIADGSAEVGRNLQDATVVFHARMPWNPNSLEQRIGRVDRYGHHATAQQFAIVAGEPGDFPDMWLRLLDEGFGVFGKSISALQEVADILAGRAWTDALANGVESLVGAVGPVRTELASELRRVNELDALESSFGTNAEADEVTAAIAAFDDSPEELQEVFVRLATSAEGFQLASTSGRDGSTTFSRDPDLRPLFSPRLLSRLLSVDAARSGFFDRWRLSPGKRLFRRGNPFIDGIENLLGIDDRGQAVAMWRWDPAGPPDPLAFFGFDFLIEADFEPILNLLDGEVAEEAVARRRADAAFRPQSQRVWIPVNTESPVSNAALIAILERPFEDGRDKNLNHERIPALHTVLGGQERLEPVARACFAVADQHVRVVADVADASARAASKVRRDTEVVLAQSRARASAKGIVSDPHALDAEVALGAALEEGVMHPTVRLSAVTCVVVSRQGWADFV